MKILNCLPLVNDFIQSLEQLTNPDLLCKDYLASLGGELNTDDRSNAITIYNEMYSHLLDYSNDQISSSIQSQNGSWGKIRVNFAKAFKSIFDENFGSNGNEIKSASESFLKERLARVLTKVHEYSTKNHDGNLGDYSLWLKHYKRNPAKDLEIPGQYKGKQKPMLEYHVKIENFEEKVKFD
jgi:DNA-dependent protein kinase catalytic subunit